MVIRKNVQNSSVELKKLVVDVDTVFVNFNGSKLYDEETKEHIGWKYDQIQYDKNEYIELISKENEKLQLALSTTTMEVLNTINSMEQSASIQQAQMLMEITKMIETMGGEK